MRHFGGAVEFQHIARAIMPRDGATGLQRNAGMAPDGEVQSDHGVRGAKRGVHVAILLVHDRGLGAPRRRELAGLLIGLQQRRQFFCFNLDQISGVFRHVGIISKHGGHRLADVTQPIGGEDVLAIVLEPVDAGEAKIDRRNVERRQQPSIPRTRPAARAPAWYRSPQVAHARSWNGRCAYAAGVGKTHPLQSSRTSQRRQISNRVTERPMSFPLMSMRRSAPAACRARRRGPP